jgi:hypothetical protein
MNTSDTNFEPLPARAGSVSDTPRADAAKVVRYVPFGHVGSQAQDMVHASFARQLERELNDANEQLHKVRIRCSEWAEVAGKHGAELDRLRALIASQNAIAAARQPGASTDDTNQP